MGGCSSTNYLVYMRGNKKDYDGWAAMGNPGWRYRDVNMSRIKNAIEIQCYLLTISCISGTSIL